MSGGGARVSISGITSGVKKMIQDIREISGEHSDEDIYAMLKECSMDPNETAQRLLHLDTFHEVKKKHGKRKENVVTTTSDIPGKQRGARAGKGAKVGGGNFHTQNTPQVHVRRSFGGSKENGYPNMSKGRKTEHKIVPASSRPVNVKINEKSIQDEINAGSNITSSAESVPVPEVVKSDETCVPADGGNSLDPKLTPATISAKKANKPLASMCPETVHTEAISPGNLGHENHYAMSNEDVTRSTNKIESTTRHAEIVDTAKSHPTVFNGVASNETVNYAKKHPISEDDTSVLDEEASKLSVSDGHVVFPEHLQVPEAYKKKLTFGSFGNSWPLDGKPTSDENAVSTEMPTPAVDFNLEKTIEKSSIGSRDVISSTDKLAQEIENSSYKQDSLSMSNNTPHLFERESPDVVIKIDEPETERLLRNERPDIAYQPSTQVFGYAPKPQLQVHDSTELQGGNFITSSTSGVDRNSNIQPSGFMHDTIPSPPPVPFLRQTYHPNFFPYGQYYPQFFVPQVQQQYLMHGGFPQQSLVPNVYLSPAAAGGIKYPHQQQKQQGTDGYIGVPSGYNPYAPYTFPYGLHHAAMPGNVAGDDDQTTQLKENTALAIEQHTEGTGEWMAGTGRTVSGMHINPFYNLAPGQSHPMVFPPTPTGFGPFGGVYHPSVQTLPAPQSIVHPHNQQLHSMGSAEPPPGGFYQQPSKGAHILHTNNKQ